MEEKSTAINLLQNGATMSTANSTRASALLVHDGYIGAAISTHYSDSDAAVSKEDRFLGITIHQQLRIKVQSCALSTAVSCAC